MAEKQEIKQFIGIYMGKMARRNYETKEGKKGVVYGLQVKESPDSTFAKSFTAYSTTKGLDTIQDLDKVKLGYVVQDFVRKDGQSGTSHKVLWIGKTDENQVSQPNQQGTSKIDISKFEAFKPKYFELCKNGNIVPSPTHMLGSYIATYEKDKVSELVAKCKEAIK